MEKRRKEKDGVQAGEGTAVRATPAWSVLPEEWTPLLTARGLRAFRADQILQALYRDYLGEPNSHKAHELLHTHYTERGLYK